MLYQAGRMGVPGTDAFVANASVRSASFGIGLVASRGVVTDWGLQAELVGYIARQRRTQLSIVLAGHGYFDIGARVVTLRAGSVVLSDQRLHGDEGYAGSPSLVMIVDWEGDGALGPEHRGAARVSHLAPRDVAALRRLAARVKSTPPRVFAARVIDALRALGLPAPRPDRGVMAASPQLARLYAALADVRTHLHEHPALGDVAGALEMSERHVRRAFDQLDRELGTGTGGWREFLADTRLAIAQQMLSVPGLSIARVASLAGFRSPVALCHAFTERGGGSPGQLARRLRERWEVAVDASDGRELARRGAHEALVVGASAR